MSLSMQAYKSHSKEYGSKERPAIIITLADLPTVSLYVLPTHSNTSWQIFKALRILQLTGWSVSWDGLLAGSYSFQESMWNGIRSWRHSSRPSVEDSGMQADEMDIENDKVMKSKESTRKHKNMWLKLTSRRMCEEMESQHTVKNQMRQLCENINCLHIKNFSLTV